MADLVQNTESNTPLKEHFFDKRTILMFFLLILGTLIYSLGVVWFLNVGIFFAGGMTGISQILSYIFFGGIKPWLAYFIPILNLPLFILGWRHLSKKFAIFTLISVVLQTIFITLFGYLSQYHGINPIFNVVREYGEVTIENGIYVCSKIDAGLRLVLAIVGGFVCSAGACLSLISGGSTGGIDVISNALLVKKNISITKLSFTVDFSILFCSIFVTHQLSTALFTLIRLMVNVMVIDKFYRIYQFIKIEVITEKCEEIRQFVLSKFYHGITIYEAKGGYTLKAKNVLEIIASRYEMYDYIASIKKIDPNAFIFISHVTTVSGKYIKKTII